MKTEREMFKKAYLNLMSGDSLPFPDAVFDEYVKLRTENGYKLVPVEPSAELVNHGHQVFLGHFNEGGQTGGRSLYFAYKAMIGVAE